MSIAETVMTANGARALIDARLDAIDRALLGRVSRAERLDVVGEVESRIGELLYVRCGPSEPSREDVLAVLAQLDPPEAYLGDDEEDFERPRGFVGGRPGVTAPGFAVASRSFDREWYGRASGVCGLAAVFAILLMPVVYFLAVATGSEIILLAGWAMVALGWLASASIAVILAAVSRMTGLWSIVGLVLGILTAFPMTALIGFVLLEGL